LKNFQQYKDKNMGLAYKVYYQCDGCGTEFKDPDQVRIFEGSVKNGEGNKIFIQDNKMYCLDCLQFALDYKNIVPETVKIIDSQELEKISEVKEKPITMVDLENKFMEINNQYLKNLTDQQKKIDQILESLKSPEQVISKKEAIEIPNKTLKQIESERMKNNNQIEPYEKDKLNSIIEIQDEFLEEGETEKFDDIISLEPEIPNEQIDSDTEQENILISQLTGIDRRYLKDSGNYLVLCQILTPAAEEYFATNFCNLKDTATLHEILGNRSLLGTYFSINKYIDIDNIDNFESKIAKVVNKILFGIPNIVNLEVLCSDDFAIIEKEKFNIQVKPAPKYKVPDENEISLKPILKAEKSQQTTVVKPQIFKDPIKDVVAKLPKKKISDLSINGDDYV
jgi:hypothetical protein